MESPPSPTPSYEQFRKPWRDMAHDAGARWRVIECVCSDVAAHQARLATRRRGIPGWAELDWADVTALAEKFEPWGDEPRIVLDAADPLADNILRALAYVTA